MFLALLWTTTVQAQAPLTVKAPLGIEEVELVCGDKKLRARVHSGQATFSEAPSDCKVFGVQTLGYLNGPGVFTCGNGQCTKTEIQHRAVRDAQNRINVIVATDGVPQLEMTCGNKYRERQSVKERVAVFDDVPADEDCTLNFKGGVPARYHPISPGTYECSLTGTTALCSKR